MAREWRIGCFENGPVLQHNAAVLSQVGQVVQRIGTLIHRPFAPIKWAFAVLQHRVPVLHRICKRVKSHYFHMVMTC